MRTDCSRRLAAAGAKTKRAHQAFVCRTRGLCLLKQLNARLKPWTQQQFLGLRLVSGSPLSRQRCYSQRAISHAAAVPCGDTPLDITLSYAVQTNIDQPIENIISYNNYECNTGGSATYTVDAGGSTFSDYFLKSSSNKPLSGLMIGTTHDLPGDAPGQQHLVLMTSSAWANAAAGIAFGALFPSTLEEEIISALQVFAQSEDQEVRNEAANTIGAFVIGQLSSAFFSLGAVIPGETTTSAFSVIAFSDGQIIGDGIASLATALPDNPVPTPALPFLIATGLIGLNLSRTRRH
jgi:hypothetical protein